MNCVNHSDAQAVAYCRTCGKALCNACTRDVRGVIYCEPCLAERVQGAASPMGMPPPRRTTRPGLAAALGFIPGVGAMYNGQFLKGFLHVGLFVFLIWLTDHVSDIFGMLIAFYFFYMVFDAYKTAQALEHGLPVPDPFGLGKIFGPSIVQPTTHWSVPANPAAPGQPAANAPPVTPVAGFTPPPGVPIPPPVVVSEEESPSPTLGGVPIGAVVLIGLGVLFLLDNIGWLNFGFDRLWPLIIIAIGAWMLLKRLNQNRVS